MSGEPWAPGLSDVARHVPTRTRDTKSPGSDKMLMTFNGNTTPTDASVQQLIDDSVSALIAVAGELPTMATETPEIAALARSAVEWRVAADIEVAYPNRDADLLVSDRLNARATVAFTQLQAALAAAAGGGYTPDTLPQWAFPPPVPWGDESPGSGTNALVNVVQTGL